MQCPNLIHGEVESWTMCHHRNGAYQYIEFDSYAQAEAWLTAQLESLKLRKSACDCEPAS